MRHDRTNASFDHIGVEFDTSVIEETGEPVPMVQGVADGFGDHRLGRDARELLFEPRFERQHERFAFFLARRAARAGAVPPNRLLDRIERRDAFENFAGDRSGDISARCPRETPR